MTTSGTGGHALPGWQTCTGIHENQSHGRLLFRYRHLAQPKGLSPGTHTREYYAGQQDIPSVAPWQIMSLRSSLWLQGRTVSGMEVGEPELSFWGEEALRDGCTPHFCLLVVTLASV